MGIVRVAFLSIFLFAAPALVLAGPVNIKFTTADMTKEKVPGHKTGKPVFEMAPTLQYYDGWPLTLKLEVNNELGIAISEGGDPFFPHRGKPGFILFADPDGVLCMDTPSWGDPFYICNPTDGPSIASDETYLEFTPDIDDLGLPDNAGHDSQRMLLVDSYSAGLSGFNTWIGAPTGVRQTVYNPDGSVAGEEEIIDGYGRGADDDLPGLVLVAQHGAGIVWDDDFTMKMPMELVNLSGYTNAVSYGLNDKKSKTFVMAQIVVPGGLFAPFAVYDTCYTGGDPILPDESNCTKAWMVEGGEVVGLPFGEFDLHLPPKGPYREVFEDTVYTVSAFVVSGKAPDRVIDMDGDLDIDDNDLELMGYDVLGSKKSTSFKQVSGDDCFGPFGGSLMYADIDNSGDGGLEDICGPTSGSITRVPR